MPLIRLRFRAASALALGALFITRTTLAADPAVCTDAYENAQTLMRPGQATSQLLPAREALRTCMRSGCKDWMVSDCSKWLGEVEARIPTVVFSAKNTAGRDLSDVSVSRATGEPLASSIDGRAIEMEAGLQTFVFTAPDGTKKEKQALVREGEKAQSVTALFDAPPEELAGSGQPRTDTRPHGAEQQTSSLTYVGYGAAGLGAVGVLVGTIFGITAIAKKNSANCAENLCDGQPLEDAKSAATVSTVGFIAGGALLAGGVALVLFAPSPRSRSTARASLGIGGPGLLLGGRW
jgi:hypothetical protein